MQNNAAQEHTYHGFFFPCEKLSTGGREQITS